MLRTRGQEIETWPDGRGYAEQPLRLILAVGYVREYFNQNEPQKKPPGQDQPKGPRK